MAIDLHWHDPSQSILEIQLSDAWTWSELFHVAEAANTLTLSKSHVVHSILDLRLAGQAPARSLAIMTRFDDLQAAPNSGLQVVVGATEFNAIVAEVFREINPQVSLVEDLSAALDLIANTELDPLS
ncbi:MAG: hypothetical protein GYB68_10020 [Chloroflexi bacterium]|nr:hypothetical protein [Chloroflexota bacterium]